SDLLWDGVRVITRKLGQICDFFSEIKLSFGDHTKRAKRRMIGIMNAKSEKVKDKQYKDLLKVTEKTVSYGRSAVKELETTSFNDSLNMIAAQDMAKELRATLDLTDQVIDQTSRRVLKDEKVPANEKILSIFEPHTDVIVKDRRDTYFGHKVCLSGGPSNLISDCLIVEGNPADNTLTTEMLERHNKI
ncbi:MAG: ISNCY family transposase, partial [Planctomycetes bacterium]|nr:ISNCY family transposase [Planctomycetota bacterium]